VDGTGSKRRQESLRDRYFDWVVASSHYHLLLDVDDAQTLSRFMCYVNSNIAREVGRLHDWGDHIWSRRYQSIVVSNEEATQIARLSYVLAHGVKENLVERVAQWPGVHCGKALVEGTALEGWWFDRTKEYAAKRRGENFDRFKYARRETLTLDPLPWWRHLSPERRRERAAELVAAIEAEAAAKRTATQIPALGAEAVRRQRPHDRTNRPKKSPAPLFHVAAKAMRKEMWEAYAWFVGAFRQAAEKLKAGDRMAAFPAGSFPPALPFVVA
jgi:hypothetical protein